MNICFARLPCIPARPIACGFAPARAGGVQTGEGRAGQELRVAYRFFAALP
jgi:hypothetical protein